MEGIMNDIEKLQRMIDESNYIVFFGGAGVSTDSGIRDFRGKNGMYKEKYQNFPPEYLLGERCFYNDTELFFDNYIKNMNCLDKKPNVTHLYLKKLEDAGKLKAIITQNIDGLHQKAGSQNVYELHGTIMENYCIKCNKKYDAKYVFESVKIPKCSCGGIIKPNVVLYGQMLPEEAYNKSVYHISKADLLIVAGTSLIVHPACDLVEMYKGKNLVIINDSETPYDYKANLVIRSSLKKIFSNLK